MAQEMRKKVISKALHHDNSPLSRSFRSTTPSKRMSKKLAPLELTHLEQFLIQICESIENGESLSLDQIERASMMKQVLRNSLQMIPNFSFDFYAIVSNLLNEIENKKACDNYLVKLAEYLQSKIDPLTQSKLESIESLSFTLTVPIISDFASSLQNKEPFKSLCLAFLNIYAQVDESIPKNSRNFSSRAVNYMATYLKKPQDALYHFRNTHRYISCGLLNINSPQVHLQSIEDTKPLPVTRKLHKFLSYVLSYFIEPGEGHAAVPQLTFNLDCASHFRSASESFQINLTEKRHSLSSSFDSSIVNTENFDPILDVESSMFNDEEAFFCDKSPVHKKASPEKIKDMLKLKIINEMDNNPTYNVYANKIKIFAEIDPLLDKEEKKVAATFKDEYRFRALVSEIPKRNSRRMSASLTWREVQIGKDKERLNTQMNRYYRK